MSKIFFIKPIKIKRGASRKSNQLAEQRDFGAPSHEVNEMSSPTPGSAYLKTKKSDTHHMSTQSIVSDSYGSFLSEGYDSLDFFGFGLWQWQCWNPSLASRVTTNTDDDESSHALQKCDLSNLFGCSYMVANSPSATWKHWHCISGTTWLFPPNLAYLNKIYTH